MKGELDMKKVSLVLLTAAIGFAAEAVTAVHGTVSKIDSTTKTVVVKAADGTEQALRVGAKTTVHGTEAAGKDTFQGLKEGSEVVAHYSTRGSEKTAVEIDQVGKDGLKVADGTVSEIDRNGKKLVVKTTDGAEQTYKLADRAAVDAGKGADKSAKVTVYYTEQAGKKIAHFFEK
jgi:arginine repressor